MIYTIFNPEFRKAFKKILGIKWRKNSFLSDSFLTINGRPNSWEEDGIKNKGKEKNGSSKKKDGTEKFAMKNSTEEEKLDTFLCMEGGKPLKIQFYDE